MRLNDDNTEYITYENAKILYTENIFNQLELKIDDEPSLVNFISQGMNFYYELMSKLSAYFYKHVLIYIDDLHATYILLEMCNILKPEQTQQPINATI